MIAIKGTEMPNACTFTQKTLGDIGVANCPLYNVCKHRDTVRTNYKPSDCPLIEIITCKDCKCCSFGLVEGIPYYWCDKDNCVTSEDFYCANARRE